MVLEIATNLREGFTIIEKAPTSSFNQEKDPAGAFSMIVKLRRRFVVSSREYVSVLKYFLHSIKASLNIYATSINVSSGVVFGGHYAGLSAQT